MSIVNYLIADPNSNYSDASANSTANNEGWMCVNGSTLRIMNQRTPASSTSDALQGEVCHDGNYLYIATGTNTWKRIGLGSF